MWQWLFQECLAGLVHKWFGSFLSNQAAVEMTLPLHPRTEDCGGTHAPAAQGGALSLRPLAVLW